MDNSTPYYGLDKPKYTEGTLLAFDFGLRRIGVAAGQTVTYTASPLAPIGAREGIPDWDEVKALVKSWQPVALVVGIPVNMDGSEQAITFAAMRFGRRLQHQCRLPVYGVDERLTSFEARQSLFDHGGSKLLRKRSIDSIAAQLILESWFHSQKERDRS